MTARVLFILSFPALAILIAALTAAFFATDPKDLDSVQRASPPIAVHIPTPSAERPPPEPMAEAQAPSLLADLAPDSFADSQNLSAGIGFGSGGGGPGLGGGGFGEDTASLVSKKTSLDRPPRAVIKTPPDYPAEGRSRGVAGFVELKIRIGLDGSVETATVEKSEPKGFFDQAALQAVRRWRFEPAIVNGRTAVAWTSQKIKFELN